MLCTSSRALTAPVSLHTLSIIRLASRSASTSAQQMTRAPKEEGSISSIFTSLTGAAVAPLPARFSDLKKEIWHDGLIESWAQVLGELEVFTEDVVRKTKEGVDLIPRVSYTELQGGLSPETIKDIKRVGSVVVTGAVPSEEALGWKHSVQEYVKLNRPLIKGFPKHDIQVYELYNTKAQLTARTHPSILATQKALLSLWSASSASLQTQVSLSTPVVYFDRLRIRQPGDRSFKLGPHVDGGSVERWEDPGFRSCFGRILSGGDGWRRHDAFEVGARLDAKQDLYSTPNQCTIFRPFQGWTSLSTTTAGEGTLRLFPHLTLSTAYTILRPFFKPRPSASLSSYRPGDWEPDLESTSFPGSTPGNTQEYNDETHPHLRLGECMVPLRDVKPGDQVYWHCDGIHAVENVHGGKTDSSVFYIPAVPLTVKNADYMRDQRIAFERGIPPPDFPGGAGESANQNRAIPDEIASKESRLALGLEPFGEETGLDSKLRGDVNRALGF